MHLSSRFTRRSCPGKGGAADDRLVYLLRQRGEIEIERTDDDAGVPGPVLMQSDDVPPVQRHDCAMLAGRELQHVAVQHRAACMPALRHRRTLCAKRQSSSTTGSGMFSFAKSRAMVTPLRARRSPPRYRWRAAGRRPRRSHNTNGHPAKAGWPSTSWKLRATPRSYLPPFAIDPRNSALLLVFPSWTAAVLSPRRGRAV